MAYKYHVFISYQRAPTIAYWVERYFHPRFTEWLKQGAGAKASVFLDVADIDTGDKWSKEIKAGLEGSCLLLPIYSPSYFESCHCWAELLTFQDREKLMNRDLIVPVVACKGDNFPGSALDPLVTDFSKFVTKSSVFEDTASFLDFEALIRKLTQDVVKKLKQFGESTELGQAPGPKARAAVDPGDQRVLDLVREHAPRIGLPLLAA